MAQGGVAYRVAIGIVDALEPIDIDEQQTGLAIATLVAFQNARALDDEITPVGKAGQPIGDGSVSTWPR